MAEENSRLTFHNARGAVELAEPTQDDMELAGDLMANATIRDGEDIRRLIAIGITIGRADRKQDAGCPARLARHSRCAREIGHGGRHEWVAR